MNGLNIGHDALSVGQPTNPVIALIAAKRGAPIFIGIWISCEVLSFNPIDPLVDFVPSRRWVCYGTICILVPNYLFALRTNPLKERLFIIALFLINTADVALDLSRVIKIYVRPPDTVARPRSGWLMRTSSTPPYRSPTSGTLSTTSTFTLESRTTSYSSRAAQVAGSAARL